VASTVPRGWKSTAMTWRSFPCGFPSAWGSIQQILSGKRYQKPWKITTRIAGKSTISMGHLKN
jgi:hypothetical protein